MDLVYDQLADARPYRTLTVVDQFSRQSPVLECRHRFSGQDVADVLDRATRRHGVPVSITVDGTEFMSLVLEDWAYAKGVKLDFIWPGWSTENGHIESFSGRLPDACLNVMQFEWPEDA